MKYYVGASGSRKGATKEQLDVASRTIDHINHHFDGIGVLIGRHGNCIGFDEQIDAIFHEQGIETECLPSNWSSTQGITKAKKLGTPQAPYKRNSNLVAIIDELIAAPCGDEESGESPGTWDTINKAKARKIKVTIIMPDGSIK